MENGSLHSICLQLILENTYRTSTGISFRKCSIQHDNEGRSQTCGCRTTKIIKTNGYSSQSPIGSISSLLLPLPSSDPIFSRRSNPRSLFLSNCIPRLGHHRYPNFLRAESKQHFPVVKKQRKFKYKKDIEFDPNHQGPGKLSYLAIIICITISLAYEQFNSDQIVIVTHDNQWWPTNGRIVTWVVAVILHFCSCA
jgi:hypothetical protein